MKLYFVVPGSPKAKEIPRMTRSGRAYTPAATLEHEARIAAYARAALPDSGWPMAVDYALVARFYMPTQRLADVDNLVKAVDGLNGVAWLDDVQVSSIHATREVDTANPRTEIEIVALETPADVQWKRSLAYQSKETKRAARRAARRPKPSRATGARKRLPRKRRSR